MAREEGIFVGISCGAAMWAAGFSIDNLSLMALAVSIGFVVDDAIVMIENVFRNLEKGDSPLRATLKGAKQIGFTVVSMTLSLVAVFIPVLFMGGILGRLLHEFAVSISTQTLTATKSATPRKSPWSSGRLWSVRPRQASAARAVLKTPAAVPPNAEPAITAGKKKR